MKIWITRVLALSFVLSLLAVPQALIMAQDEPAATPVIVDQDEPATPAPKPDVTDDEEASTPAPAAMSRGSVQPLAQLTGDYGLTDGSWNESTGVFALDMTFFPTFTAMAGDTIDILYTSDALAVGAGPHTVTNAPMTVTVDAAMETITLTFTADFVPTDEGFHTATIALDADVIFTACLPTNEAYYSSADIAFVSGDYYMLPVSVDGPLCPVSSGAAVLDVEYAPELHALYVLFSGIPDENLAGTQLTITYPTDILVVEPGPVDFYTSESMGSGSPIATAVASNGVITITFIDDIELGREQLVGIGYMEASISSATCVPDSGVYEHEIGRINLVATPGGSFTVQLPSTTEGGFRNTILCNAAPATKTGEISEDGSEIYWTIDTGDLLNNAVIADGVFTSGGLFSCGTLVVTPVTPNTTYDVDCTGDETYGFAVYLYGEGPVRATITVTAMVNESIPQLSYLNCASIVAGGQPELVMARSVDTAGVAGLVCAEVFPPGGGDTISNVVSAAEVYQGDTLTFNVSFSTTSFVWWTITLDDVLPAGFSVTDVSCTFEPVGMETGDCQILDDNTISVGMRQSSMEETALVGGSVSIEITGEVTAAPGTELVSEACGERAVEVPGLAPIYSRFGTGPMCASTSTMVLQVPVTETPEPTATVAPTETPAPTATVAPTETPSPTATAEPTVPATPGASPTVPVTPDPTSTSAPVTGLPETGNGISDSSAMLMVMASAAFMMVALVAVRIRTGRV